MCHQLPLLNIPPNCRVTMKMKTDILRGKMGPSSQQSDEKWLKKWLKYIWHLCMNCSDVLFSYSHFDDLRTKQGQNILTDALKYRIRVFLKFPFAFTGMLSASCGSHGFGQNKRAGKCWDRKAINNYKFLELGLAHHISTSTLGHPAHMPQVQ